MNTVTTQIDSPSTDQLEEAWWKLMGGELGVTEHEGTRQFMQMILDHAKREVAAGVSIVEAATGEEVSHVTAEDMAKRMCAAYASIFYPVP